MEDEIREEKLDSPLVVHKKSDASYQEMASEVEMSVTHTDEEETPTLERHRFKKVKKKRKYPYVILVLLLIGAGIFAGIVYSGTLDLNTEKTSSASTRKTYTTKPENRFENTIVIKSTYIFVDGKEVFGIDGLERAVKYEDPTEKQYEIIDEHADSNFLNYEVLSLLENLGFTWNDITHVQSTGLISAYETTVSASSDSTVQTSAVQETEDTADTEENAE